MERSTTVVDDTRTRLPSYLPRSILYLCRSHDLSSCLSTCPSVSLSLYLLKHVPLPSVVRSDTSTRSVSQPHYGFFPSSLSLSVCLWHRPRDLYSYLGKRRSQCCLRELPDYTDIHPYLDKSTPTSRALPRKADRPERLSPSESTQSTSHEPLAMHPDAYQLFLRPTLTPDPDLREQQEKIRRKPLTQLPPPLAASAVVSID